MDNTVDHRHQRRIKIMQNLFACTFSEANLQTCLEEKKGTVVWDILNNLENLDRKIQVVAPERPLNQVNQIDLAILRLILYESLNKKTPIKVLINEAIELAKEFGSDSSSRFVNGVLAKLLLENTN